MSIENESALLVSLNTLSSANPFLAQAINWAEVKFSRSERPLRNSEVGASNLISGANGLPVPSETSLPTLAE